SPPPRTGPIAPSRDSRRHHRVALRRGKSRSALTPACLREVGPSVPGNRDQVVGQADVSLVRIVDASQQIYVFHQSRPSSPCGLRRAAFALRSHGLPAVAAKQRRLVGATGIEPVTPTVSR